MLKNILLMICLFTSMTFTLGRRLVSHGGYNNEDDFGNPLDENRREEMREIMDEMQDEMYDIR